MNHSIEVHVLAIVFAAAAAWSAAEAGVTPTDPYFGQKTPGDTAKIFAPDLFANDESVGCSGFMSNGTVFVFSSMKVGTDWRFKSTYVMDLEGGIWTAPRVAPFNDHMPYNFTVGPGGKTLYFTSLKSSDKTTSKLLETANLWAVTLTDAGWTEPVMLGSSINTDDYSENYPTVSKDGTAYYMSRRADSIGKTDIYRSIRRDNRYDQAENLGAPINSSESDQDPFIAPDGSYLIVCLTGRPDSHGSYDLYVSFPEENGAWSDPANLGVGVNSPGAEFRPYVTEDGKYLFYTRPDPHHDDLGRIFWVSAAVIEALRPSA